jgi:hypothetical protein
VDFLYIPIITRMILPFVLLWPMARERGLVAIFGLVAATLTLMLSFFSMMAVTGEWL